MIPTGPGRTQATRTAAASLLAAALGCSSFAGGDDRLVLPVEEQVTARAQPDPWWCLGEDPSAREIARVGTGNSQVTLRLPLHDQFTQMPPNTQLEGRLCSATDLGCTRPITNWTAVPPDGRLTTLVPSSFTGYAEVRGNGYPDSLFVVDVPVLRDLDLYSHPLVSRDGLAAIGQVLMTPVLDEGEGLFVASVLNCEGVAAEGVVVELSSSADPFVIVGGVPVAGSNVTGPNGTVAFNRVSPGPALISATLPDGRKLREQAVEVRGGWFSAGFLRPIVYSANELCAIGVGNPVPGRQDALGRLRPCQARSAE